MYKKSYQVKKIKIIKFKDYINESKVVKYKKDDIVLIEYWYNGMVTPVRILELIGTKYKISHNIEESDIFNAPDEIIFKKDIITFYTGKNKVDDIIIEE